MTQITRLYDLHTDGWSTISVTELPWSEPHETPIAGFKKVKNCYGFVYVVEESRLTLVTEF